MTVQTAPSRSVHLDRGTDPAAATDRRRSRRVPTPGVLVGVELAGAATGDPDTPAGTSTIRLGAGSAIDLSLDGLALALPCSVPIGAELLLTFKLDDDTTFSRVPSSLVRTLPGMGVGAVRFDGWTDTQRRILGDYLTSR